MLLVCESTPADLELVNALLLETGATAVQESVVGEAPSGPAGLKAGFESAEAARRAVDRIGTLASCRLQPDDMSWVLDQRAGLEPSRIGPWYVRAPWHPPLADADDAHLIELIIDPGSAFGHGAHPSTALLLELLPELVPLHDRIHDVGTGSGILAIAAAHLGAVVTANDIDPAAVAVAKANAVANRVADSITFSVADVLSSPSPVTSGMAVINMTADMQRQLAARIQRVEIIAISGILEHQADDIRGRYPEHELVRCVSRDEWNVLVLSR